MDYYSNWDTCAAEGRQACRTGRATANLHTKVPYKSHEYEQCCLFYLDLHKHVPDNLVVLDNLSDKTLSAQNCMSELNLYEHGMFCCSP